MKRLGLALAVCLTLISAACAQGGMGPGPGMVHSVGAYAGPGDVIASAKAGWSFRAWTAAVRGNNAVLVCNSGDAACVNMVTDATSGDLVITTVGGTDCSVSTCTVKTLYDQTGSTNCTAAACDVTQATEALRPVFKTASCGGKACMQCTGASAHRLSNGALTTLAQTFSIMAVVERTSGSATSLAVSSNGGNIQLGLAAANTAQIFMGSATATVAATDNAFHALATRGSGATSVAYADGTAGSTASAGTLSMQTDVGLCARSAGTNPLTGFFAEAGFWAGDQTASFATLSTNQHSYFGF